MTETVLVYAKKPDQTGDCPFCNKAKAWLQERGIPFTLEELDWVQRQDLYDRLELIDRDRTVPQIILTDEEGTNHRIGGYTELVNSGLESLFRGQEQKEPV